MTAGGTGGLRNRRGAIVVMTGIFIVALMMIAAISIDASRIFAAKNELQTASDAGALAGALQLLENADTFADTARAYAERNRVEQDGVDSVEIEYGVWMPADRAFVVGGEPKDAVRVTTRHPLRLSLARVFGDSTVTVTASAIAWSAGPVMEPQCIKPLAVPYGKLLQILNLPPMMDIELNDDDVRRLREMDIRDRRWHFHFGNLENQDYHGSDDQYGENHFKKDQYFPIDIDSTWIRNDPDMYSRPSVDPDTYQTYMAGPPTGRCSRRVRPGDGVRSEPAPKMDAMRNGLSDICLSLGGSFTRANGAYTCRRDGASIPMPLRVVYWAGPAGTEDMPGWYNDGAAAELESRATGSFVVESLDWNDDDSRTHARMWGYFDVQPAFGVVDETVASTLLRPVLVR